MLRRYLCALMVCGLAWGWPNAAAAEPKWPLVPGGTYGQRHPEYQPGNPDYEMGSPACRQPVPYYGQYPWYGSAWGVQAYNWGYFGASSCPTIKWHKAYYRDFLQWGQWRRY